MDKMYELEWKEKKVQHGDIFRVTSHHHINKYPINELVMVLSWKDGLSEGYLFSRNGFVCKGLGPSSPMQYILKKDLIPVLLQSENDFA
jgi:hypothetical protein